MKAAASSVGGRNVACVWSQCDMEKGAKQTGTDGSENQSGGFFAEQSRNGRYSQRNLCSREQRCSELAMTGAARD